MPQYNQGIVGGVDPGTLDLQPPFPEIYLRNFVNDLGIMPSELQNPPLFNCFDNFNIVADQLEVTLSQVPSQFSIPIVYLNGRLQTPTVDYSIVSRTITFPALNVGDIIAVHYESEHATA